MKTLNEVRAERKLSETGNTCITKKELTYSKVPAAACVVPAGIKVEVFFSESNPERVYFEYAGSVRAVSTINAHKYFTGFKKCPSMNTLEKWSNDGIAKSVTGKKCEPDGYSNDFAPSWLLVMGVI
jgi:hypothetical protein